MELCVTRKELNTIKTDKDSFRELHLDDCAEEATLENPKLKKASYIKHLKHIEKQIRESSRVSHTLDGQRVRALTHVLIPSRSSYHPDLLTPDFDHTNMDNIWK